MAAYLAKRIMKGKLNYNVVIAGYPEYKSEIDLILAVEGYTVRPEGTVTQ